MHIVTITSSLENEVVKTDGGYPKDSTDAGYPKDSGVITFEIGLWDILSRSDVSHVPSQIGHS